MSTDPRQADTEKKVDIGSPVFAEVFEEAYQVWIKSLRSPPDFEPVALSTSDSLLQEVVDTLSRRRQEKGDEVRNKAQGQAR